MLRCQSCTVSISNRRLPFTSHLLRNYPRPRNCRWFLKLLYSLFLNFGFYYASFIILCAQPFLRREKISVFSLVRKVSNLLRTPTSILCIFHVLFRQSSGIYLFSKCASCDFSVQWRCVINIVQAVGSFPASTRIFPSSGNLTVVNLSPEDDGVYECVAASVVSSVITTTLLIIESIYFYLFI